MKKTLILLLTFLPLTILGQQLKCCKTDKEVELYLSGKWRLESKDKPLIYHYEFKNGKGFLHIYSINKKNELKRVSELEPIITIIKNDSGFEIETRYKFGGISNQINYLDSKKLIVKHDENNENHLFYKIL